MTNPSTNPRTPEQTYEHLQLIQPVITRMSAASASAKGWLLPVIAATYGYAITAYNPWVALLGLGAVLLFLYLDANYLREEKRYRRLYDAVARGDDVPLFTLTPSDAPPLPGERCHAEWQSGRQDVISRIIPPWGVLKSWSIAPFYIPLALVGLGITGLALLACAEPSPVQQAAHATAFRELSANSLKTHTYNPPLSP